MKCTFLSIEQNHAKMPKNCISKETFVTFPATNCRCLYRCSHSQPGQTEGDHLRTHRNHWRHLIPHQAEDGTKEKTHF